jgi:hypothetical protein
MDKLPSTRYRKRWRLAAACGATIAAAFFTPVPATAEMAPRSALTTAAVSATHPTLPTPQLAGLLISTGMIGVGLAMGGLVIVAHRRRQW